MVTDTLECVDKFCYLGDMIGSGGAAEDAPSMRVKCAWGRVRELSPILSARRASLKLKGKVYRTCVQSVMVWQRDVGNEGRGYAKTRKNREDDDQMDVRVKTE